MGPLRRASRQRAVSARPTTIPAGILGVATDPQPLAALLALDLFILRHSHTSSGGQRQALACREVPSARVTV